MNYQLPNYLLVIFNIITSSINFFLIVYINIVFVIFGYSEIGSKGFITLSLITLFTHGLSGNIRNIYIGNQKLIDIYEVINLRFKISCICFIFSSTIIFTLFSNNNYLILISLSVLSYQSWYLEIALVKADIKRKIKVIFFINTLLAISFITVTIFYSLIHYIPIIVIINFLGNTFLFKKLLFKLSAKIKLNEILNLGIISTFIKSFANFFWRYSAYILIGANKSGVLFVGFAIGSFLATIFDVSYGGYYMKLRKNIYMQKLFYFINFLYCVIITIGLFIISKKFEYPNILILTSFASIIGSFFMISALKVRQVLFLNKKNFSKYFKLDIISYCFNTLLIPILFILSEDSLIFSYLCSSLFFYLLYKYFSK